MSNTTVTMPIERFDKLMRDRAELQKLRAQKHYKVRTVAFKRDHALMDEPLMSNVQVDALTEKANKELAEHIEELRGGIRGLILEASPKTPWWRKS